MELRLMQLRKSAGFSNRDKFADLIGVNRHTYKSWETGTSMMSLEQAYNCAIALGCTLNDLVGMKAPNHPAFSDPRQEQLNGYYECMNDTGRRLAVDSIKAMSSSIELRMVKEREVADDQAAMEA